MKISVIIPCYNCEYTIEKCVSSITSQDAELEIICVDDCSSDNTVTILKGISEASSNIRVIKNSKNVGASRSRNIGIKYASGDYITFVDSDDYLEPHCYEKIVEILKKEKPDILRYNTTSVEISDAQKQFFDRKISIKSEKRWIIERFFTNKDNLQNFSPLLFVKKNIVLRVKYNEKVHMMEDAILYFDLINESDTLYLCDIKGYNYVRNDKSITQRVDNIGRNVKDIIFVNEYITNRISNDVLVRAIDANTIDIISDSLLIQSKADKREYYKLRNALADNEGFGRIYNSYLRGNVSLKKRLFMWTVMHKCKMFNNLIISAFRAIK